MSLHERINGKVFLAPLKMFVTEILILPQPPEFPRKLVICRSFESEKRSNVAWKGNGVDPACESDHGGQRLDGGKSMPWS